MQEGEVYFDESEYQLPIDVEDWYAKNEETEPSLKTGHSKIVNKALTSNTTDGTNKFGLGFSGKKEVSKSQEADALAEKLLRNKKRKQDALKNEESYMDAHKIIDDIDISRTSLDLNNKFSKGKKTIPAVITSVKKKINTKNNESDAQLPIEQSNKNNNINNSNTKISSDSKKSVTQTNEKSLKSNISSKSKNSLNHNLHSNSNIEVEQENSSNTIKRKKKRSKQKNIRKDTRSEDMKPIHLRIDAGEAYEGRVLTQETIQRLNIKGSNFNDINNQKIEFHNNIIKTSKNTENSITSNKRKKDTNRNINKNKNKNKNESKTPTVESIEPVNVEWCLDYNKN